MRAGSRIATVSAVFSLLAGCAAYDVGMADSGTFAACCDGLGTCVPHGLVPASLAVHLAQDACDPGLLCAPESAVAQGAFQPAKCAISNGSEGRCVLACLPEVARVARLLQVASCGAGEVCAPCSLGPVCHDGQVEFVDGAPVRIDGPATIGIGIAGKFDLTDAVDAVLGKEHYVSEKRWFLEQTVQLREKLTAAARTEERARSKRELERVLERILAAPELDAAHKHARVLALWEDCGGDADSADTRRLVETFVRTRMPAGSDLAFSREELERWNRGRAGPRFEPYES